MSGGSSPFDAIHLRWQGKTHTIAPDRVMGAIQRIEDHLTLAELQADAARGTLRLGKMSAAFASVLRYAGAEEVTASDVYAGMFGEDAKQNVVAAVALLLGMMIPTNVKLGVTAARETAAGKEAPRRVRRAAAKSSKRRSN